MRLRLDTDLSRLVADPRRTKLAVEDHTSATTEGEGGRVSPEEHPHSGGLLFLAVAIYHSAGSWNKDGGRRIEGRYYEGMKVVRRYARDNC